LYETLLTAYGGRGMKQSGYFKFWNHSVQVTGHAWLVVKRKGDDIMIDPMRVPCEQFVTKEKDRMVEEKNEEIYGTRKVPPQCSHMTHCNMR
jgi:hypothetical protein